MMKEGIQEYYPNGKLKYRIIYHSDGSKWFEQYCDDAGRRHREDYKPDFQSWYNNGMLLRKTYIIHGKYHNINNSADIYFLSNGKILEKMYCLKNRFTNYTKLAWMNQIKKI